MAILTLLWNIFLPLELTHLIKPDRRASSTHIVSHPDMMVEGEMNGRGTTGLIHPFTATLIEIITGNIAIIGWICESSAILAPSLKADTHSLLSLCFDCLAVLFGYRGQGAGYVYVIPVTYSDV